MSIRVHSPGFLTTLQDQGRLGYQRFGVPVSGPMDSYAHAAANQLVGNSWNTCALEVGITGPVLEVQQDCLLACCGAGFELFVNGKELPLWTALFVRRGSLLELRKKTGGSWAYLAVRGGFESEPVLGSSSTYLKAEMGKALQSGDLLPFAMQNYSYIGQAGAELDPRLIPEYSNAPIIEVIPGPQDEYFTKNGWDTFLNSEYQLSGTSDRMGYRLEGPALEHSTGADILSDALLFGSIQVPANGQPIIMMSERPTTGGYAKIATVARADMPVLAQCVPDQSSIHFLKTSAEAARQRYCRMMAALKEGIHTAQEKDFDQGYPFLNGFTA